MARKSSKDKLNEGEKAKGKRAKNGAGEDHAPPTSGSNVTNDTIGICLARVDAAAAELDEAKKLQSEKSGIYRSSIKAAKKLGLNNDAILEYRRMKNMEPGDYASMMKNAVRFAEVMKLPIGTQLSIFGEAAAQAEAHPYNAGRDAAENREPEDNNPHLPGSEAYQDWSRGYQDRMVTMLPGQLAEEGASVN